MTTRNTLPVRGVQRQFGELMEPLDNYEINGASSIKPDIRGLLYHLVSFRLCQESSYELMSLQLEDRQRSQLLNSLNFQRHYLFLVASF